MTYLPRSQLFLCLQTLSISDLWFVGVYIYIYIYIYIYERHTIGFQTFFVGAFTFVIDSGKFSMLLLYILWDGWPIFMISGSNQQPQQQLEYTLLKPHCHSWWISKMQSGREDTLEERYAIKFCFKLWKKPQKRMECFRLLFDHLASVFWVAQEIQGRWESVRDDERCGRSKEVYTPELIGQRVRVTMLRF